MVIDVIAVQFACTGGPRFMWVPFMGIHSICRPITCFCYVLMISSESQKISWKCQIFLLSDEIFWIISHDIMRNSDVFIRFSDFLIIWSERNKSRWSIYMYVYHSYELYVQARFVVCGIFCRISGIGYLVLVHTSN